MGKKISLTEVQIIYDQRGEPHEVVMSYELFQQLETMVWERMSGDDLNDLLDEVWQDHTRNGVNGRVGQAESNQDVDDFLEWLEK